ncbi:MAG: ABC transporter permease [Eubacterium sp.]|nr:ABC transporter permease [Eubacterium sp.]
MIRYILTKILNKYKLYLCLIIGNVSIIMIFAMIMMFREGSERKIIQKSFTESREMTGLYPASLCKEGVVESEELVALPEGTRFVDHITDVMNKKEKNWEAKAGIPCIASQRIVMYQSLETKYSFRGSGHLNVGYMEDGLNVDSPGSKLGNESFKNHYRVVKGKDLYEDISDINSEGAEILEGAIPCLVSEYTADILDLVPGEIIFFHKIIYGEESSETPLLTLYVNGVIKEKEEDYFWHKSMEEMGYMVFMSKEDFANLIQNYEKDVYYECYDSYDYRYIDVSNVYDFMGNVNKLLKSEDDLISQMPNLYEKYTEGKKSVEQMLYVIVLPLIVLVLIFIGMIAFRIIDSERGELQTLRNRGLSAPRLIGMYLIQSIILAAVSIPLGIICGYFFGKFTAGVDDFMGFSFGPNAISTRDYQFTWTMVTAGSIAGLVAVIIMMMPVILFFIKKKDRRNSSGMPAWEKYFLDVGLLIVSIYLLFNYNKQISSLSQSVLNGEGIDPVIFINATLFLFSCGMLMLRFIFYIVGIIYRIGKNRFSPVTYACFLQIIRTRKGSAVISIFLVMTVAMSLFNANMARTINANTKERIVHDTGTDVRIQEHWDITLLRTAPGAPVRWRYNEPSYNIYEKMCADGIFSQATKVVKSSDIVIEKGGDALSGVMMMGINTKEFGQVASLKDGITPEHWYNYLNALAEEPNGVIINKIMADTLKVKEGDSIELCMLHPKVTRNSGYFQTSMYKIVAIVDVWPGFSRFTYFYNDKGKLEKRENYLAVINYSNSVSTFGNIPYEVWARTDGDYESISDNLSEYYGDSGRYVDNIKSWKTDVLIEKSSSIIQITNGLFTADYLIALILCIIGYMIYWITSIRDRELLFGIYRAMGISRKEINIMIAIEQLFLSFMSILAGVGAGTIASKLFVMVFAAVYLPRVHSLPIFASSFGGDLIKLGMVLIIVIVICVIWLRRIVKGLNITEALKLGDD